MNYQIGEQFEDFLLLKHCGSGAYGSVFFVRNVISNKEYALKIIPESSRFTERELYGIRQYQAISPHNDLMQIHRVGKKDDVFYYVMDPADNLSENPEEYIPDTLQNRIKKYGKINSTELFKIASHLEQCLKKLHSAGLLHRDIKPANILFINGEAMPGDVGLVTEQKAASLAGTAAFISPETLAGLRAFGPEDDFYALGKTLYCALTGNAPEKYPAFPQELKLSECREILRLYNFWINMGINRPFCKKKIPLLYPILLITFLLITAGIFLFAKFQTTDHATPVLGIKNYKEKVPGFISVLRPEPELQKIHPQLEKKKRMLWNERTHIGLLAYNRVVTPDDLRKARKKTQWLSDPETFLRIQRKDDAVSEFDEHHKNNTVLRYFSLLDWFNEELRRIEILSRTPGVENTDFSADFKTFQKKISEFKEIKKQLLLKKN